MVHLSRGVGGSGGPGGARAPRNLADQLTLFKPGGHIMPVTLLPAPPPPPLSPLCVEMGFTRTCPRNQDATVKLKSELISIKL